MTTVHRHRLAARVGGLLAACAGLAVALSGCSTAAPNAGPTVVGSSSTTSIAATPTTPTTTPAPATSRPTSSATPTSTAPTSSATPTSVKPSPTTRPEPAPVVILRPGDSSPKVRELQARLKQLRWYDGDVTNYYGTRTVDAVRGFQGKRGFAATGVLDERTWNRVVSMSRPPTRDELDNVVPKPVAPKPVALSWDVDQRCLTGRVICISKTTRSLTWVVDGVPQYQFDVRFGSEALPTREGTFSITWKKKDVISTIYHTPMPYSMFFSGGQAIHYSSNFARLGYNGSSHGCVNVRDWNGIVRLYNEAPVGTKVVIHW